MKGSLKVFANDTSEDAAALASTFSAMTQRHNDRRGRPTARADNVLVSALRQAPVVAFRQQTAGETSATDLYALSADNAYRSVANVSPVSRSRKRYDRRLQYCAPTAANAKSLVSGVCLTDCEIHSVEE